MRTTTEIIRSAATWIDETADAKWKTERDRIPRRSAFNAGTTREFDLGAVYTEKLHEP
jgi:hypothetical protein